MDLPISLTHPTVPPVTYLLVLLLGAYVSVDMGQRVRHRSAAERRPWLLTAVVALSTGLWSAAVLSVVDQLTRPEAGFDPALASAAALATLALALPGLHWSLSPGASRVRALLGAATLGAAAMATQILTLSAAAQTFDAGWNHGLLILAWLAASSGFGWGLHATRSPSEASASPQRMGWQR